MVKRHNHVGTATTRPTDPAAEPDEARGAGPDPRHAGRVAPDPVPIAVIGIGCRVPGAAGPEEFWREVSEGGQHVTAIPADRFDAAAFQHSRTESGQPLLSSPFGGFLDGVEEFDAEFFGVSPYEAARMDPQQRQFLETAWEAVEDAGLTPADLAGTRTGVYTAHLAHSYWDRLREAGVWDVHAMTGSKIHGNMPARLAHVLDLRGPTAAVDATCSSSLLAVHLACQALRLGDIDAAVVGGANLIIGPEDSVIMSQGSLLSPTGQCRFGDAAADGFVRGEAVAVVILKPLDRALADGDRVYSVILGTAATNDGASNGQFLTPSAEGQEETLRAAYRVAGVAPLDVDYVEAHGVGTQAGDLAELSALGTVLGAGRSADRPLLVGSAKTNFGHGESAAGLVGLIKTALALHHREIPATLHLDRLNPRIDWEGGRLRPVLDRMPWPSSARPRFAGVSAFGISGSNVHVVMSGLDDAEPSAPRDGGSGPEHAYILPFSARSAEALSDVAEGYGRQLGGAQTPELMSALCYSAGARRAHHRFRGAVVGADAGELTERVLRSGTSTEPAAPTLGSPRIVYVFPGLGAQWTGMARDLLVQCPPFARALRRYDAAVREEAGWSVLELLASDDPLTDVGLAQPAVWAVECALAEVWTLWGVTADTAIGHSMGEVAAATVSGALSLADAAAVICRRSALMRRAAGRGAMTAVALSVADAALLAKQSEGRIQVAVCNSPTSTVLAGDVETLRRLELELEDSDVFCRRLRVDAAAHSDAMDPLLGDLVEQLDGLRPTKGRFPLESTVYDRTMSGAEFDAGYWAENLRLPVHFDEAVRRVLDRPGPALFIEMTPHALLTHDLHECIDHADARAEVVTSLRRGDPGLAGLLKALGQAYAFGAEPDWAAVTGPGQFTAPPRYPWRRRSFQAADTAPNVPPSLLPGSGRMRGPGDRHPAPPQPTYQVPEQRTALSEADLSRRLREEAAGVLSADAGALDPNAPVQTFGLDSLLAIELVRRFRRRFGYALSIRTLLQGGTLNELAAQAQRSGMS